MCVCIIDYGMGNLMSVQHAFEKCGGNVRTISEPSDVRNATHLVLPGVGTFRDGMRNLKSRGWIDVLNECVLNQHIPILGICLGMQLLASKGYEVEETRGLNYICGEVIKMVPTGKDRVPHVGWDNINIECENALLDNVADETDFYFVHSYRYSLLNNEDLVASTSYIDKFPSIIVKDNIYGVQFHPEKSQKAGFQIIHNFLKL